MQTSTHATQTNTRHRSGPAAAVVSFALLTAIVFGAVYLANGRLIDFVNLPAALIVGVVPLVLLTTIYGWAAPIDAFYYALGKRPDGTAAREAAQFFQTWAAFALASGFVATLIAIVAMLGTLNDPAQLGPWTAAALLTQLYGVCIAVACIACSSTILRRARDMEAGAEFARRAIAGAGMTVIAGVMTIISIVAVLMLAFAFVP